MRWGEALSSVSSFFALAFSFVGGRPSDIGFGGGFSDLGVLTTASSLLCEGCWFVDWLLASEFAFRFVGTLEGIFEGSLWRAILLIEFSRILADRLC